MGIFSDEQTFARDYYDVTGKEKAEKGLPKKEKATISTKRILITLAVLLVLFLGIGYSSYAAKKDSTHYDNRYSDNIEYNAGYDDGLSETYDESNATDDVYNDGYKDGCKDRNTDK